MRDFGSTRDKSRVSVCQDCAIKGTSVCPYSSPNDLPVYGCYRFEKRCKTFNKLGEPTSCGKCRFLFRKPRSEVSNRSYIMCGVISSLVKKISPIPNCPNFRPMREKQIKKRTMRKKGYPRYRHR